MGTYTDVRYKTKMPAALAKAIFASLVTCTEVGSEALRIRSTLACGMSKSFSLSIGLVKAESRLDRSEEGLEFEVVGFWLVKGRKVLRR